MKLLLASTLAVGLAAATGLASAQNAAYEPSSQGSGVRYDYARVLRVDPVFDSRYGSQDSSYGQRCYDRQTYVSGGEGYESYGNGSYRTNGSYDGDGYYDRNGNYQSNGGGTRTGATMATVIGGIVGAALGSQVGGGSARYATAAVGSMVGGMAGRQIYDRAQRQRQPDRVGTVTVCDPVPVGDRYGNDQYNERAVGAYDVTYEYASQQYTTRTSYHPGDRIRVRVDVRAE